MGLMHKLIFRYSKNTGMRIGNLSLKSWGQNNEKDA